MSKKLDQYTETLFICPQSINLQTTYEVIGYTAAVYATPDNADIAYTAAILYTNVAI